MILMYHKVHPNSPTIWWVLVNDFYRQMSELSSREVVYLSDYDVNNLKHVVITFDGIYKNVLEYAMPILKHFNYPFELFLTSDYIGLDNQFDIIEPNAPFTTEDELKELVKNGGRLQWHTQSHMNLREVTDLKIIEKELTIPENIKLLDQNGFNWFAYPHGEFNEVVLEQVKKKFKGAVTCFQGNDKDKYILNRLTIESKTSLRINKIACIIASYNYGDYLIEAIESVLRQTVLPNEILISDDCSDDDTQLIAEVYVKKYPDLIKFNRNNQNLGVVDHFNKAIALTTGEYVFFLGADNRLLSNYIEETIKVLDSNDKIAVAYTDYAFFGTRARLKFETIDASLKGEIIHNTYFQVVFPEFENHEKLTIAISKNNFIHGSSVYRRQAFQDVLGYIKQENTPEDYNLFKRIILKGWLVKKATKTNLEYRQHSIGQADNILIIQAKMMFYKNQYLAILNKQNTFENSKIYRYSLLVYKSIFFFKKNYNKPIVVLKKIKKISKKVVKKKF